MIATTFKIVSRAFSRLRYPANPEVTFPLNQNNRAYLPDLGRWASDDPMGLQGGLNLYAYADSAPTNLVDPQGLQFLPPGPGAPSQEEKDAMKKLICVFGYGGRSFLTLWIPRQTGQRRDYQSGWMHCMTSCWIAKCVGGPDAEATAFDAGFYKEYLDLVFCRMGAGGCAGAFDPEDFKDNYFGFSCPQELTCEERCEPKRFKQGGRGPFAP